MMIVREALAGSDRYQDFRDALGISDNTLTRRLGHLQQVGVLVHDDPEPGVYRLTDAGNDLARVLAVLGDWAMRWMSVEMPLRPISQPVIDAAEAFGFEMPKPLGGDKA